MGMTIVPISYGRYEIELITPPKEFRTMPGTQALITRASSFGCELQAVRLQNVSVSILRESGAGSIWGYLGWYGTRPVRESSVFSSVKWG